MPFAQGQKQASPDEGALQKRNLQKKTIISKRPFRKLDLPERDIRDIVRIVLFFPLKPLMILYYSYDGFIIVL